MPASTPVDVVKVSQLGTVVPVMDSDSAVPSVLSTSAPVTVYEYATSSVAVVSAVLDTVGASFAPLIVTVTVIVVPPSELVTSKVSVIAVLPESRAFTVLSLLSRV
jgi:hypothetical protein